MFLNPKDDQSLEHVDRVTFHRWAQLKPGATGRRETSGSPFVTIRPSSSPAGSPARSVGWRQTSRSAPSIHSVEDRPDHRRVAIERVREPEIPDRVERMNGGHPEPHGVTLRPPGAPAAGPCALRRDLRGPVPANVPQQAGEQDRVAADLHGPAREPICEH